MKNHRKKHAPETQLKQQSLSEQYKVDTLPKQELELAQQLSTNVAAIIKEVRDEVGISLEIPEGEDSAYSRHVKDSGSDRLEISASNHRGIGHVSKAILTTNDGLQLHLTEGFDGDMGNITDIKVLGGDDLEAAARLSFVNIDQGDGYIDASNGVDSLLDLTHKLQVVLDQTKPTIDSLITGDR